MKNIYSLLLLFFVSVQAFAAEPIGTYEKKVFQSQGNVDLPYRILYPRDFDESKKYPLVLFLHGAGERGDNNEAQLFHGGNMFLNPVNRDSYPAVVIFPQCPNSLYWALDSRPENGLGNENFPLDPPLSKAFTSLTELLDSYVESGYIDKRRIYIIGLSMGCMGTYDLVSRNPGLFAAAVTICGGVRPERLQKAAKDTAFRIYHGDADGVVPVDNSREIYSYLKKSGAKVEYYEFAGCDHGSWNVAFNQPDFMKWLFKQRK